MVTTGPLRPTPARIVEHGRVHEGWFARPFDDPNLDEGAPRWMRWGRVPVPRRLRFKQWHYLSVVDDRVFFACAVVDAGYVNSAFAYVVDLPSGRCVTFDTLAPPGTASVAPTSLRGRTEIKRSGWGRVSFERHGDRRQVEVDLEGRLDAADPAPPVRVRLDIDEDEQKVPPVVVVERSAPRRWLYTHKAYGCPASGRIEVGSRHYAVTSGRAGFDYNRGYRPRDTWWNWAAASGETSAGTLVGFNLTAHRRGPARRHDGRPDAADCAVWVGDGESVSRTKIDRVDFHYDPRRILDPWRVTEPHGRVDLHFTPLGQRREDVDFGVVVSRFTQPYGWFNGTLRLSAHQEITVDRIFGVVEQHHARW
ncbi:MAG: DUF2804 domain-containing protein [Myxococcota bacterium]